MSAPSERPPPRGLWLPGKRHARCLVCPAFGDDNSGGFAGLLRRNVAFALSEQSESCKVRDDRPCMSIPNGEREAEPGEQAGVAEHDDPADACGRQLEQDDGVGAVDTVVTAKVGRGGGLPV